MSDQEFVKEVERIENQQYRAVPISRWERIKEATRQILGVVSLMVTQKSEREATDIVVVPRDTEERPVAGLFGGDRIVDQIHFRAGEDGGLEATLVFDRSQIISYTTQESEEVEEFLDYAQRKGRVLDQEELGE